MSVTFFAEIADAADTRVFRVVCTAADRPQLLDECTGYVAAYLAAQAHGEVCPGELCRGYGADIVEVETRANPLPVNMGAGRAARVLRALGLPVPPGETPNGMSDARRFLDLITAALAAGAQGEDDYLALRLTELRDLAEKCAAISARICWA